MRGVAGVLALATAAGCHVTARTELAETISRKATPRQDAARAQPPTIVLADGGFRFVEPLVCPSDEVVELQPEIQVARRANLATFVVGVIAVAGGAIAAISGLASEDPGANPLSYGGGAAVAIGLPLAIGPWFGNRVDTVPAPRRTETRVGGDIACGSRPVTSGFARLVIGERVVYGAIGPDGALAVSPFTWIDAFEPDGGPAFSVRAQIDDHGAVRMVDKVFEAGSLAPWRETFLASTGLDVSLQPLRAVPRITAGAIRVGHVLIGSMATLRITLPLTNAGPGDAWQVRATITATSTELDRRIVYVGHIAPGATVTGELWVPLSPKADEAIRRGPLHLTFTLRDAHKTLGTETLEFRGTVEDDGFQ